MRFATTKRKRLLCLLTAITVCAAALALPALSASAAEGPTSLGLAAHGIKAHRDGWRYQSGAKGGTVTLDNGKTTRASDCAGLIYAYFSDMKALGSCAGGATSQVERNCVFSNNLSEGLPNIHGLVLTMPDYRDPGTGIYGHIGIYIGGNEAADNSDYTYNMRREIVIGNDRNWNAWHVFDNGMKYPVNGWYVLDGKMVHYTNYEYDADTTIDGYAIDIDGYARESDGGPFSKVDESILSSEYASASQVAAYLRTKYSGKDSTYELIYGSEDPVGWNGRVTGSGVNLRREPNTQSAVVTTLSRNAGIDIDGDVPGEVITADGISTNIWYHVSTAGGYSGYICSLYAERVSSELTDPVITVVNGYVNINAGASDADIYYTIDGTEPDGSSTPYTGPLYLLGHTYKAIAIRDGKRTAVTTATVLSNGSIFTDFTEDAWYFSAVDQAVAAAIFEGSGGGKFNPAKQITRAQFVTALANLDRVDLSLYGDNKFSDGTQGLTKKMSQAIAWAASLNLVGGFPDGTFRPNAPITREQMCQIMAKYAGLTRSSESSLFADDQRISSWAKDAVYACRENGLISGVGQNRFDPKGTATRAQACVITVNLYKR